MIPVLDKHDILPAAIAFREAVTALDDYWIALAADIATSRPMTDGDGHILAETVFQFVEPDKQWWKHSLLAVQSPLAQAARYESEPFWANADGFRARHPNAHLRSIDLSRFEERALVRAAIVVPVYLPFGQIGLAAFGPRDPERHDLADPFERHADRLKQLSHRFVAGYVHATRRRQWLPANCSLSNREIECLRLASTGKNDQQIADLIGCKHATVRFHLRNAGAKLNAVTRPQIIFKAAQLGYLSPAN
jgi:DNA-binding CsgD family transcriptional regulator